MPWARVGDDAATYPRLMATAAVRGADERTVNEVAGFVFRCAFQSAGHKTDYIIDAGTVQMIGGPRWRELVRAAERVKLLERTMIDGLRAWRLPEDDDWIHIRTRAELEWDNRQRNDTRDPRLMVPVRLRDGDQCRYCRIVVVWAGPRTNRSATLDHLAPGEAGTVDTLVVACFECNQSRGKDTTGQWAQDHQLHPAPARPLYGATTVKYLLDNGGHVVEQNIGRKRSERPSDPDPARAPQPNGATPVRPGGADPAPSRPRRRAPAESPPTVSNSGSDKFELAGSGREGSTLVGPGRQGEGESDSTASPAARRRGRRGGRSGGGVT